jgi:hypothetical protein
MMEAARTSETSVDKYFTRQYNPEDKAELHTCRRENLKSHIPKIALAIKVKINPLKSSVDYTRMNHTLQPSVPAFCPQSASVGFV